MCQRFDVIMMTPSTKCDLEVWKESTAWTLVTRQWLHTPRQSSVGHIRRPHPTHTPVITTTAQFVGGLRNVGSGKRWVDGVDGWSQVYAITLDIQMFYIIYYYMPPTQNKPSLSFLPP